MNQVEAYRKLVTRAVEIGREYVREHRTREQQILQSYWWEKYGAAPPEVMNARQLAEVPWPKRHELPQHREIMTLVCAVAGLGGFKGMSQFYDDLREADRDAYLALHWNFEGVCGWTN